MSACRSSAALTRRRSPAKRKAAKGTPLRRRRATPSTASRRPASRPQFRDQHPVAARDYLAAWPGDPAGHRRLETRLHQDLERNQRVGRARLNGRRLERAGRRGARTALRRPRGVAAGQSVELGVEDRGGGAIGGSKVLPPEGILTRRNFRWSFFSANGLATEVVSKDYRARGLLRAEERCYSGARALLRAERHDFPVHEVFSARRAILAPCTKSSPREKAKTARVSVVLRAENDVFSCRRRARVFLSLLARQSHRSLRGGARFPVQAIALRERDGSIRGEGIALPRGDRCFQTRRVALRAATVFLHLKGAHRLTPYFTPKRPNQR